VSPKIDNEPIYFSWGPKVCDKVDHTDEITEANDGVEQDETDDDDKVESGDETEDESKVHADATEDADDGEGEWVSSTNLHRMGVDTCSTSGIRVACITGDFSIQNVLLQMGLQVLSIDYHRIRTLKLWGLICRGCGAFSRDTTKLFCQKCGNATVDRVPITVEPDGSVVLHDSRKRINNRGTIYDIPKPKGGRNNKDMIFCEDQMMMGGRDREHRHQLRMWEKERQRRDPFNPDVAYEQQGWWSRTTLPSGRGGGGIAPPKMQVGFGRGNPNSNRWRNSRGK